MTGPEERVDDLKQRYLEASAQDERRPADRLLSQRDDLPDIALPHERCVLPER